MTTVYPKTTTITDGFEVQPTWVTHLVCVAGLNLFLVLATAARSSSLAPVLILISVAMCVLIFVAVNLFLRAAILLPLVAFDGAVSIRSCFLHEKVDVDAPLTRASDTKQTHYGIINLAFWWTNGHLRVWNYRDNGWILVHVTFWIYVGKHWRPIRYRAIPIRPIDVSVLGK